MILKMSYHCNNQDVHHRYVFFELQFFFDSCFLSQRLVKCCARDFWEHVYFFVWKNVK